MAKRVVLEVRNGEVVVLSCSKGVEVIVKKPKQKKKGLKKRLRTAWYHIKKFLKLV